MHIKGIINSGLFAVSQVLLLLLLVITNVDASQANIRTQLEQKKQELAAASAEADKFRNARGEKESLASIQTITKKLQSGLSKAEESNRKLIEVQVYIKGKSQTEIGQSEKEINKRLQPFFYMSNGRLSPYLDITWLIMGNTDKKLRSDVFKASGFDNYNIALQKVQKTIQNKIQHRQEQLRILQNEQRLRNEVASLENRLGIKSIDRETESRIKWLFGQERKASKKGEYQQAIQILESIINLAQKVKDRDTIKRARVRIKQLRQQIERRSLERNIKNLLCDMESLVGEIIHRKYNLHVLLHSAPHIRQSAAAVKSAVDDALKLAQNANQSVVNYGDRPDTRKSYDKLVRAAKTEIPRAHENATAARKKACDANNLTDARQGAKEALEIQKKLTSLVKKLTDWLNVAEKQRIEKQIDKADSKIQEAKGWIKKFGLDSAGQLKDAVAHARQKIKEVRKKKEQLSKVLELYRKSEGDPASYMKNVNKLSTQADKNMQQLSALQSGTKDWVDNKYEEKIKQAEHAVTLAKTTIATQKQGIDFDKIVDEIRGWFSNAETELGWVNIEAGQAGVCLNKMLQQFGGFFIRGKAVLLLGEQHVYQVVDSRGKPISGVKWASSNESILKIDRDTGEAITCNPGKLVVIARKNGEKAFLDVTVTNQQFTGKPPTPPPPVTPSQFTVPKVIGLELGTAEYDIKEAGLQVGNVREQEDTQRAGVVIAQDPSGGTEIPNVPGADLTMDLTISLGPEKKVEIPTRTQLSAVLDCGDSFELAPGDFAGRGCGIVVKGWRGNTDDRVQVKISYNKNSGIEVFPGDTSAPPSLMYTPGVTDYHDRYIFSESFRAKNNAQPGTTRVTITVSQAGAGSVTLTLDIAVLRKGQLPSTDSGIRPPADVTQGSGGEYCVWRFKVYGDPPQCFHFAAAKCDTPRYSQSSYELVGQNMWWGEADARVSELSRYFKDAYGCLGEPSQKTLLNVVVTASKNPVNLFETVHFTALAIYDGSQEDITGKATWPQGKSYTPSQRRSFTMSAIYEGKTGSTTVEVLEPPTAPPGEITEAEPETPPTPPDDETKDDETYGGGAVSGVGDPRAGQEDDRFTGASGATYELINGEWVEVSPPPGSPPRVSITDLYDRLKQKEGQRLTGRQDKYRDQYGHGSSDTRRTHEQMVTRIDRDIKELMPESGGGRKPHPSSGEKGPASGGVAPSKPPSGGSGTSTPPSGPAQATDDPFVGTWHVTMRTIESSFESEDPRIVGTSGSADIIIRKSGTVYSLRGYPSGYVIDSISASGGSLVIRIRCPTGYHPGHYDRDTWRLILQPGAGVMRGTLRRDFADGGYQVDSITATKR